MNKNKFIVGFIVFILIALIMFLHEKFNLGIPCVFHIITGLYCPGCGLTRAVFSILHLEFYKAFRYNMLIVVLMPITLPYLFYKFVLNGNKKIPNFIWYFLVVITVAFGVLRNIPYFSYLAPINI